MGSSSKKALGTTGEFFRRRDEWRKHPMLTNQLRHATPGLGIALVAFGVYLVGEQVYNRVISPSAASSSHAHSHSHSASTTSATHWASFRRWVLQLSMRNRVWSFLYFSAPYLVDISIKCFKLTRALKNLKAVNFILQSFKMLLLLLEWLHLKIASVESTCFVIYICLWTACIFYF